MVRNRIAAVDDRDAGFSLIELLVTMVILGIILSSLAVVQTRAMVTIAQAKERQQATALANRTLEELRALPWNALQKGLSSSFPAAGDPNVSSGRLRPPSSPAIDEPLVVSAAQVVDGTARPLAMSGGTNVMLVDDPETPGRTFTVRSYVSHSAAGVDGPLNLTVIVSWERRGDGQSRTVLARSSAYSPSGGCGGTENQPFLGACQAFFTADAGTMPISITITGAQFVEEGASPDPDDEGPWPVLAGTDYAAFSAAMPAVSSNVGSEQATTVRARAILGGLSVDDGTTSPPAFGLNVVDLVASDDVSTSHPLNPTAVTQVGTTVSQSYSGDNGTLSIQAPSSAAAQVRAAMTAGCGEPGSGVACSRGDATGSGTLRANFTAGGTTTTLAEVAFLPGYAWSGRNILTPGTLATGCATLGDSGCTSSRAGQTTGTVTIGGGPAWDGGTATNGLVRVTGYTTSVRSEYGSEQLNVAPVVSRGGSVQWWNGSSYSTITLNAGSDVTQTFGPVTRTEGGRSVRAVGTISVLPATVARANPDPTCQTDGCSLEAVLPPVTISVTYFVDDDGDQSAFTVVSSIGGSRSATSFKAAPID